MEKWDEIRASCENVLAAHAQFQEEYASLGGKWRFLPLTQEDTIPEGWPALSDDGRKWERMMIPCTAGAEGALAERKIVAALYCRSFTLSRQPGSRRILFRFQKCPDYVRLWVNGQLIGCAAGIAGEAEFDITSAISPEKNQICMEVRCPGGSLPLIREDVGLYTLPGRCITDVQAVLQPGDRNQLRVQVRTRDAEGFAVRIALMDENRVISHRETTVEDDTASALLACPELPMWCPEKPVLYRIAVILWDGIANYHTRELTIGLHTAVVQDHVLLVNGQPEKIYALDYPIRDQETGLLLSSDQMEAELQAVRNHNFNGIRLAEAGTEALFQLCDRLGLYVLEHTGAEAGDRLFAARSSHPCLLGWDLNAAGQSVIRLTEDLVVESKEFLAGAEQVRSFDKYAIAVFGSHHHCMTHFRQAKAALAPITCTYDGNVLTIHNHSRFCSTGTLEGRTVLLRDGSVLASRALDADVPPCGTASVPLETKYDIYKPGRYHLSAEFRRRDTGALIAMDQWDVGMLRHIYDENPGGTIREEAGRMIFRAQDASYTISRSTACPEQIRMEDKDFLTAPLLPVFAAVNPGLHIPDEWERFTARWKRPKPAVLEVDQMTRTVTATFRLGSGLIQTYRLFADGSLSVDLRLRTGKTAPECIGLQGCVSALLTRCRWFGLGPEHSDAEHRLGRYFGIHTMDTFDGLQRDQVYDLTITDIDGAGFRIRSESALRFALKPVQDGTQFTVELAQDEAFLPHTTYNLSFTLCPVR